MSQNNASTTDGASSSSGVTVGLIVSTTLGWLIVSAPESDLYLHQRVIRNLYLQSESNSFVEYLNTLG